MVGNFVVHDLNVKSLQSKNKCKTRNCSFEHGVLHRVEYQWYAAGPVSGATICDSDLAESHGLNWAWKYQVYGLSFLASDPFWLKFPNTLEFYHRYDMLSGLMVWHLTASMFFENSPSGIPFFQLFKPCSVLSQIKYNEANKK